MQNITHDRRASHALGGALLCGALLCVTFLCVTFMGVTFMGVTLMGPSLMIESLSAAPLRVARLLSPREAQALNARLTPRVATVWRIPRLVEGARAPGGGVGAGAAVWLTPRYLLTASAWLEPSGFEREVALRVGCEAPPSSARAGRPGEREALIAARAEAALPARVARALPSEGLALLEVEVEVEVEGGGRGGEGGCPPPLEWGDERGEDARVVAVRALLSGLPLRAEPEEVVGGEGGAEGAAPLGERRAALSEQLTESLSARLSAHLGALYPTRALYAASPQLTSPARLVLEGRGAGALAFFWLTRAPLAPGLPLFDEEGRLVTLAVGGLEGAALPLSARAALAARLVREWGLE